MSRTKEREISLLNDQQRMLKQANEAEINHRMEIEQKNAAIKNLLDHAGQGFLFFDSDLIISEEYSKECD
jgi:two-component system chemotaxis sensor kinase CheA